MVKSRDISVSLTKGDSSPEPQPHLNDSDNDNDQKQQKSSIHDDIKSSEALPVAGKFKKFDLGHKSSAGKRPPVELEMVTTGSQYIPPKVPNPFYFRVQLTTADKIKVALMTMLVLPIRVFLVVFFLFLTWIGCFIGLLGYSEQELESKPIKGWRRKWWHPFFAVVMRQMFIWGGLEWEFRGQKASRSEAPLLVIGPHQSFLDGVIVLLSGGQAPCTKIESRDIPLLGTILRFIQPVFVKRSSKESRLTTLSEIKNRATSTEAWSQIVIFPEGTCSNGSVLLKFKQGAFSAGVPVQPVLLRYPNKLNTLTWTWDGPSALKTMWLTTCQWRTRMVIEYLPVYRPSEAECNDPALYAYNVRNLMAKALGIGTTEFGFDDLRYLNTGDARQPHHTLAVVKLLKFRAKNGLTPEQLPMNIERVNMLIADCVAANKPVRLSRMEVLAWFGVAPSEVAKELFDALEMENDTFELRPEGTPQNDVDLRALLATLHLANKDGASAFRCLCGSPATTPPPPGPASPSAPVPVSGPGNADAAETESLSTLKISLPAFCRLCWLAMQMPRQDAELLFENYQPTPSTFEAFSNFLIRHSDRCKGIAYFDSVQRLDLGAADAPLSGGSSDKSDLAKTGNSKIVSNGGVTTGDHVAAVTSNGRSKRQKAD